MVRYHIDEIDEDMVLGESIFLPSGELLLSAGQQIKDRYRRRLREMGFLNVMVQVEGTEEVVPQTTVSDEAQREMAGSLVGRTRDLSSHFAKLRRKGVDSVEQILRKNKKELGVFAMSSSVSAALEKFIDEIFQQNDVVLNLSAMHQLNEELFVHTMNVAITALCIGRKYHLSYDELKQLGIGALNYDLGLVTIPQEVYEKEDPLSEEDNKILKQHPVHGYYLLSGNTSIPPTSAAAALQHHEHQNGTGYPQGIRGENRPPLKDFSRKNMIHRFAEIVAVADQFDMMTAGRRHYSRKFGAAAAIERLIRMGGPILNSHIVKTLVEIVPVYPVGARIRVVDAPSAQLVGYTGVVAKDNPSRIDRPLIILYETRGGRKSKPVLIDMAKHDSVKIELVA